MPKSYDQHFPHSQPVVGFRASFDGFGVEVYGEPHCVNLTMDDACLEFAIAKSAGQQALAMLAATLAKRDA